MTAIPQRVVRQLLWTFSDDGQDVDLDAALSILDHEGCDRYPMPARQRAILHAGHLARAIYAQRVLHGVGFGVTLDDLLRHRRVIVTVEGGKRAIIDEWLLHAWVTRGEPHPHTAIALLSAEAEPQFGNGR